MFRSSESVCSGEVSSKSSQFPKMQPAASFPARQLNSKKVKQAAESYLLPLVDHRLCVVWLKCIWEVAESQLEESWNLICEKRAQCDDILEKIGAVAFFVSSIASHEVLKKQNEEKECSGVDEENQSSTDKNEKMRIPALVYWIAFESRDGAPISLVNLNRKLLDCEDVTVKAIKVLNCNSKQATSTEIRKHLWIALKDHSSSYMAQLVQKSFQICYSKSMLNMPLDLEFMNTAEKETEETVVRFVIVDQKYSSQCGRAVRAMIGRGLKADVFGAPESDDESNPAKPISAKVLTSDPCTQLIHNIEAVMKKFNYSLCKGTVYKKDPDAIYTYFPKCDINQFVGVLEGNEEFKDSLVKFGKKIRERLSNPETQLIRQMKLNYDLIEVNDGWCLSIARREFITAPIEDKDVGLVTPRAYFPYDHLTKADGKFFREILENSLSPPDIKRFCEDFLGLFVFQGKQHKQKVPCLVGEANSGKTSLLAAILGIVNPSNIARVTKQRSFNKAMIDGNTEVIILDEATVEMMDIDDWKLLTQGGWTAHDVKYNTAKGFVNRCPMIIACQVSLEFKEEDKPAMAARLNTYHFKELPTVNPKAFAWIKKHPVECLVYAINMAGRTSIAVDEQVQKGPSSMLTDFEKDDLLSFSLDEIQYTNDDQPALVIPDEEEELSQCSDMSSSQQSTAESRQQTIERIQQKHSSSFCSRLLTKLKRLADAAVHQEQKCLNDLVEMRRVQLVQQGIVDKEEANETITEPFGPLPEHLEKRRSDLFKRQNEKAKELEEKKDKEEAKRVYQNSWLIDREKELYSLVQQLENEEDEDKAKVLHSMIEILENKLKLHHQGEGTLKNKKAIEERRATCIGLNLVTEEDANQISDVYSRLHYQAPKPDEEDDLQGLLSPWRKDLMNYTPPTPQWTPKESESLELFEQLLSSPRKEAQDPLLNIPPTPKYTPREDYSQSTPKRKAKSTTSCKRARLTGHRYITNFFSSQNK